jgi:hypothetical protein
MNLIQVAIILYIIAVLTKQVGKWRSRQLSGRFFAVWFCFWIGIAIVTAYPKILNWAAMWMGVGRGVDVAIYAALLLILYLVYRLLWRVNNLEKKQNELIRQLAHHHAQKPGNQTKP